LDAEVAALLEVREQARRNAEADERRLLLTKGEELVSAVYAALTRLGFRVIDADKLPQHAKGRKQEDLRITDEDWVCIAEVKGHGRGGARTADLMQLEKATKVFVLNENREPDAQWYIVNQAFEVPPAERPRPFASAPEEVEILAGDNGLVIDTRDLFRLDKAVQQGALHPSDARQLLRDARGVLQFPASEESA
jgi:hypothetical protein